MANVLSTNEMDKVLTEKEAADRHKCMRQCRHCSNWTQQELDKANKPCIICHLNDFDPTSSKSLRTYNPLNDRKRKVK